MTPVVRNSAAWPTYVQQVGIVVGIRWATGGVLLNVRSDCTQEAT